MLLLMLIVVPLLELLVYVEVGLHIGFLLATLLLIATSVLGAWLLRVQGRASIERVTLAVNQRRAPGRAAVEGLLAFLGGGLLVIPGFLTDMLGLLLIFGPTRGLARRWIGAHYGSRVIRFAAGTGRYAATHYRAHADVESTAVEDDLDRLGP